MAKSVDPDETAHYGPSQQDLHCLHSYLYTPVCRVARVISFSNFVFVLLLFQVIKSSAPMENVSE